MIGLVPGLFLWLILILTIILFKANRTPKALLILIPLLIVNLIWFVLKMLLRIAYLFDLSFVCVIVAISVLMLLAHKRAGCNRFFTFLWAVAVSILIGAAAYLSYSGLAFSQEMTILIVFYAVSILAVLLGIVFAAHCCRKYYSPVRFILWLAVCTPAGAILAMLIYAAVAISIIAVTQGLPASSISMLVQVLVVGLVFGGILYAIELPFIILILSSSFFRKRFHGCFRLKGMEFAPQKASHPAPEHILLTKAPEKQDQTKDKVSNKWMDPPRPND